MLQDYYKRFNPDDCYEQLLFRAGKGLQSAELNDMQAQVFNQIQGIADTILKDGDIVAGGDVVIAEDGTLTLGASKLYLRGQVRTLPAVSLTIPVDQILDVGVWLAEIVVTELEDLTLRDPAQGTHNYDEPGAGRLQVKCMWGLASDNHTGNFYPVYRIDNGALIVKQPPPQLDTVSVALARYDREANGGNYVVDGMRTSYRRNENDQQVFSIAEGKAHILGYEISFPTAIRKSFAMDPDLQTIQSEPHRFEADEQGEMRVNLSFSPLHDVRNVDVTVETTRTITHGTYAGAKDPLPDMAVLEIVSVQQGETAFQSGSDYKLTSNQVDWSLNGSEPAPGSTYTIVYQYRKSMDVTADETGFTLSGVVPGSLVLVDYQWKMPRIDALTLDRSGTIRRMKGVPNAYQPTAPAIPDNQLRLAQVKQTWRAETTLSVEDAAVRSVSMATLGQMQSQITDLYQLLAVERLRNNATAQESASKYGVFVDPFLDDDMRDQGIAQTAAIVDGELVLPVNNINVVDMLLPDEKTLLTLDYTLEPVIEQMMKTGQMKVNPYKAFAPLPAIAKLSPSVDRWVQVQTIWASPATRYSSYGGSGAVLSSHVSQYSRWVSQQYVRLEYIRVRDVTFQLSGFGPGETLDHVWFDGVEIEVNQ